MYVKIASFLALLALATATTTEEVNDVFDEVNDVNDERELRNNRNRGPCPNGSSKVVINFDRVPGGQKTKAGDEIAYQWYDKYGIYFSGTRANHRRELRNNQPPPPVLVFFDSSNPRNNNRNFGSPNERCNGCRNKNQCPGVASNPWKDIADHTNCRNQNRVLIIDSGRNNSPDPNNNGGTITINFDIPIPKLLSFSSIGLLPKQNNKLSGPSSSKYTIITGNGQKKNWRNIQSTGDNSWGVERLNFSHNSGVSALILDIDQEFAMTHLQFCFPNNYHNYH